MKLTAFILLTACLQLSARTVGQTVTLSLKDAPMKEVFREIRKQTGFDIFISESVLNKTGKVTLDVKNMEVTEVLERCFRNEGLTYTITDGIIYVQAKSSKLVVSGDVGSATDPPPVEIHGQVTDSLGHPLIGASVIVKGSKKGTSTDGSGNFILKGIDENAILVISYTGYLKKEIMVNGSREISVFLDKSNNPLDEIQVIAYGSTTRRLSTGDISTVKAETIAEQPVSNVLAALEGRVTGLVVIQNTGVPGGGFSVQIQGQNSIASGNNPYYIVDGVPFTSTYIGNGSLSNITYGGSPLNNLNPADIESIDVLKDADATAIYGSRGANGVILITTKKGKAGKTRMDLNFSMGAGTVGHKMDLLNTPQYLAMRHEAFANDGAVPGIYDYDLTAWDTTRYTDWQKTLYGGTAQQTNAQVSISGGDAGTQFVIGGTYFRESTIFPGSFADQKISTHFNLNHISKDNKFRISLSGSYLSDQNNLPENDLTRFALTLPPDAPPVTDSIGKLNWGPVFFDNPMRYLLQKYNVNANTLISNGIISYQIIPELQAKINLGFTQTYNNETVEYPISAWLPIFNLTTGRSDFSANNIKTWITEPQLIWTRQIESNQFEILMGTTFQQDRRQGSTLQATGYSSDALLGNLAAATNIIADPYNPPYDILYRYTAFFGRVHFDHKGKYIFNLTGRRDGSSRFGENKQFANFGALGAAWIFSKEAFFNEHLAFLSFGKLTASYGITGNDQIKDYQYLSIWQPSSYTYLGTSGLYPTNLANQNYAWETNNKWETGLELGFLKDAILFSIRYYHNQSSNQLVGYSLPTITGFPSVQANLPAVVQNTGLEFELNATAIKNKSFSWYISFNLTVPHNKLLAYPNIEGSSYASVYEVGKSLYTKKLFHYTEVDPQTGVYQFETVQNHQNSFSPVYPDDLQAIKQVARTYYGGLMNTFNYKNWKLDVFFQFVKQTGYNYMNTDFGPPGFSGNQPTVVLNRWQKPGDKTNVQRFTQDYSSDAYTAFSNAQYYGDNSISDASFIRLKNVSLSYQIPFNISQKAHIQSIRLFVQGQNLITFTNYLGLDPENQSAEYIPPLRMIVAGLQISL